MVQYRFRLTGVPEEQAAKTIEYDNKSTKICFGKLPKAKLAKIQKKYKVKPTKEGKEICFRLTGVPKKHGIKIIKL